MKIAIVGLGLIGASFCKAFKEKTEHTVLGLDNDPAVLEKAAKMGIIDRVLEPSGLAEMDLTIVALYPEQAIAFLLEHVGEFRRGSTVIDVCGVKAKVVNAVDSVFHRSGVHYVGTHPMAGREFSGIDYSSAGLYDGASFILTPTSRSNPDSVEQLAGLAMTIGFGQVVSSSPEEHDRVIAYTSQLAHIVSNAYVKSPSLKSESGFSAGSFRDLTRVAKCNPAMWTSLFLDNREALLAEVDILVEHLNEYRSAIAEQDSARLFRLLEQGSALKEWSLANDGQKNNQ